MNPVTTVEAIYRSVRQRLKWNEGSLNRNESMVDCWAIRDCPTICPWYTPILCRIGMEGVVSTKYTNSNREGITWMQHCNGCFDVIGTSGYCHFLWCAASIDHYHLVGWEVVQHEIGIEWHWRDVTLIEWERLSSFTSFFLVLPSTSIILIWFIDGIEEGTWSYTYSVVN